MARGAMAPAGRPHPGLVLGSRLWASRDKGSGGYPYPYSYSYAYSYSYSYACSCSYLYLCSYSCSYSYSYFYFALTGAIEALVQALKAHHERSLKEQVAQALAEITRGEDEQVRVRVSTSIRESTNI